MKLRTTLLAAMGCLVLVTSCKDPDDNNKTQYATNKAGERLVERIDYINNGTVSDGYYFEYNSDRTIKTMKGIDGDRIFSFEKKGNTLFMHEIGGEEVESSFDLNEKGWIVLDRGWDGSRNYRPTYDDNGYLQDIFDGDELFYTFQWQDGNIVNEEVTYIPTQAHPSNIDWCAFFQSWRHENAFSSDDERYNEFLIEIPSIGLNWGFYGYLGNKSKGLLSTSHNGEVTYSYDFDEDGFVSTIYKNGDPSYKVSYLKK